MAKGIGSRPDWPLEGLSTATSCKSEVWNGSFGAGSRFASSPILNSNPVPSIAAVFFVLFLFLLVFCPRKSCALIWCYRSLASWGDPWHQLFCGWKQMGRMILAISSPPLPWWAGSGQKPPENSPNNKWISLLLLKQHQQNQFDETKYCNFRGNSLCVDLWAASRLEIRIAAVWTCFLGFFWSIKSKIRSKSILGATSAHASTASSSVSWTAESSNAFEPWHGPRSHNLIRAQHSDRDNGNIVSTNVRGRGCPHQIKLFRQDSFANEWLKSSGAASHGNKHQVEASKRTPLHAGYTVLLLC